MVITRFQKPQYKVPLYPQGPQATSSCSPCPAKDSGFPEQVAGPPLAHACRGHAVPAASEATPAPTPSPPSLAPPSQPPGPLHPSTEHRCGGGLAKSSMGDINGGHQHGQLSSRNSAVQPHPQVRQSYVPCFGQYHIQVEAFNCQCPAPWPVFLDLSDCGSTRTPTTPKANPNPFLERNQAGWR